MLFLSVSSFSSHYAVYHLQRYTFSEYETSFSPFFFSFQAFSSNSDIDWSRSIGEIDEQLYEKYELEKDEIEFIYPIHR